MTIIGKQTENKKPIEIDLPRLIENRLLVQANSGGGKSWAIRKLLEETHGKVQQIVLDLEGEFSTLREKYDYILAGKEGDIPIQLKTASLLAKRLLEHKASTIIDLYELKQHERILFVKRFIDSLMNLPKHLWHPCLIVIDEAHIFCPEKSKSESMSSVIDLCTRGRKRGYCAVLATQRLSKLHKDAAAECNNKLIGRTGLDVDMKRASDELGFNKKAMMLSLREMEPGEFYVFGPAISKSVTKIKVGPVRTSHPQVGSRQILTPPPATSKVKGILAKLVDLPKEADEELRTTEDLKRKIRQLKIDLRRKPKAEKILDQQAIRKAQLDIERQYKQQFAKFKQDYEQGTRKMNGYIKTFEQIASIVNKVIKNSVELRPTPIPEIKPKPEHYKKVRVERPRPYTEPASDVNEKPLKKGAMNMLKVAAMFFPRKVTRQQIATMVGFSVKGGTFGSYLSNLKRNGWITEQNKRISATDRGLEMAGDVEELPTDSDEIINMWAGKFKAGAAKMLKIIAEHYPDSLSREELGEQTGFTVTGGTFGSYLSNLRRNGLIIVSGNEIKATKELFMED